MKLAKGKKGKHRPSAVRRAIARAMAGHSNFQGKRHSDSAKQRIGDARGHDDRIDGRKWIAQKRTGKTYRKYSLPDNDYRYGR